MSGMTPLRPNLDLAPIGNCSISGAMPACPARNVVNCMASPNGPGCIRLIRIVVNR